MNNQQNDHRAILRRIAHRVMLEHGLLPDFSPEALTELGQLQAPAPPVQDGTTDAAHGIRDLRHLLWASIDNDDSMDLDQLTVAEILASDKVRILVAIADVDTCVSDGCALDRHARSNTTSVYTAAEIFPMLPEKVSTDLTSLNMNQDRLSVVIEMVIGADGSVEDSAIYRAWVYNHAKLAYKSVAAWLDEKGEMPEAIAAVPGLAENLQVQDRVAQSMHNLRHSQGALSLETIEAKPTFEDGQLSALETEEMNRARHIIEDFMVAANGVSARYLASMKFPSIRRVVRAPKRWDRIVEIAQEHGFSLPETPDSRALEDFLVRQKAVDPLRFPDLSLSVIKLLGAGEYVAEQPDGETAGHFGLAVRDYSHSTAPNRRYPDLLTQRLLKAALAGQSTPYTMDDLEDLAVHCTKAEDEANKVERQVGKSAAALLLESRIGEKFDAIVTGAADKGTWVRLIKIPVEGKLVHGFQGLDIGHRTRVQLVSVDVDQGYIDFKRIG